MKTCPNPDCNFSGIPDEAKFCPKCGAPLSKPFLYGGKGKECENDDLLIVDIRQCKRISGLGWEGIFEFGPGLPKEYKGFYAMFDECEGIQILVQNGQIDTIILADIDPINQDEYHLEIWHGEKNDSINQEEWIFKDYFQKYNYNQVTCYGFYKNGKLIPNNRVGNKDKERLKLVLHEEIEKLTGIYDKEFQEFFGMPFYYAIRC